jgi:hypothetical protein
MAPRVRWLLSISLTLLGGIAVAQAPVTGFNEIPAPPKVNVQDKEDVWVLDFKFKSPRVINVDIAGRGKKNVLYLWYQVSNKTGQPRTFIPDFELVTRTSDKTTVHADQVLPKVQAEIAKLEDPTGFMNLRNSVTIAAQPIPATKPDSNPVLVTGVAIWPDVFDAAPSMTSFSIFVSGLSNGWSADDQGQVRRKTLQLNFRRYTDARHLDATGIQFVPPHEWVYRATSVRAPALRPAPPADK